MLRIDKNELKVEGKRRVVRFLQLSKQVIKGLGPECVNGCGKW